MAAQVARDGSAVRGSGRVLRGGGRVLRGGGRVLRGGGRGELAAIVTVVLLVTGLGVLLMRSNPTFSRLDELEHFNYVVTVVEEHRLPRPGDHYTQTAMHTEACQGYQLGDKGLQPCDAAHYDPARYPNAGVTSAGGYPPAYYLPTAVVAVALRALPGMSSLFLAARLASLLWLVLGAVTTFLLARRVGAGTAVAAGVAVLAATGPMMLAQGTTVNPDAMALLAGSGAALTWLSLRRSTSWTALVGAAAVLSGIALVKGNFLTVPAAVVLAEVALALTGSSGWRPLLHPAAWSPRAPLGRAAIAVTVAEVAGLAWSYLFLVRDRPPGLPPAALPTGGATVAPWNVDRFLHFAPGSFTPLGSGSYVRVLDHGPIDLLTALVNVLVVSGAVAAVLVAVPWPGRPGEDGVSAGRAVGVLAAAGFALAAPVVFVLTAISGSFVAYPPRYSLFLVPLGLAALAAVSGRRGRLLVVLAVLLALVELRFLLPGR